MNNLIQSNHETASQKGKRIAKSYKKGVTFLGSAAALLLVTSLAASPPPVAVDCQVGQDSVVCTVQMQTSDAYVLTLTCDTDETVQTQSQVVTASQRQAVFANLPMGTYTLTLTNQATSKVIQNYQIQIQGNLVQQSVWMTLLLDK